METTERTYETESHDVDSRREQEAARQAKIDALPTARPDRHIWGIYIFLFIVSVVELYSASSREVSTNGFLGIYTPIVRHTGMLLACLCIILALQRIHYRKFLVWIPAFALLSVGMMIYVLLFGEEVNGARRSLSILGVTLQPSEFLKLSAAGVIALVMSIYQTRGSVRTRGLVICTGVILFFTVLLMPQGLTNTLLLLTISFSMLLICGVSPKLMFGAVLALVALVAALYGVHRLLDFYGYGELLGRMDVWVNRLVDFFGNGTPEYEKPITSENAQKMYSFMAQAHGGVTGVLPGNSREAARLPLAFSDYIYSIIVEDLGLVGGIFVILAYLWLLGRASAIASRCSRAFPAFMVIGMALVIVYQALFHIAIVTGFFPVSGQPLPLISKGGTSILITSIAFGVMLSISRYAVRNGKSQDIKLELEILPEEARAENPTKLS